MDSHATAGSSLRLILADRAVTTLNGLALLVMLGVASFCRIERIGERVAAAAGLVTVACSALLTGLTPVYALAVVFWAGAGVAP